MLICFYLASAALFYLWVAKRAPVLEEPALLYVVSKPTAEVIELYSQATNAEERKAA